MRVAFLAVLILLLPTVSVAGPVAEARCTEVDAVAGQNCICSEPLDFSTAIDSSANSGFFDPPDSEGVGSFECLGGSISAVRVKRNSGSIVPVLATSVGLNSGPTYVFPWLQSDSDARVDDNTSTFTDGTYCFRFYEHFSSDFTAPTNANQNIKGGRLKDNVAGNHLGYESEFTTPPGGEPNLSRRTFILGYNGSNFWTPPNYHMSVSGDMVSLQDCMDDWCRVEVCFDHNLVGIVVDKVNYRMKVVNIGNGDTAIYGPKISENSASTVNTGDTTRYWSGKTGEGGYDSTGWIRYASYVMAAKLDVADDTFWIGGALEIEGGIPTIRVPTESEGVNFGSGVDLTMILPWFNPDKYRSLLVP